MELSGLQNSVRGILVLYLLVICGVCIQYFADLYYAFLLGWENLLGACFRCRTGFCSLYFSVSFSGDFVMHLSVYSVFVL